MSKHTPGPWSVPHFADENSACACSYVFSDAQRGFGAIATVQFGGENESYGTAKANANLIAAAPDLLEALELMASDYMRKDGLGFDLIASSIMFKAIAKARGEA